MTQPPYPNQPPMGGQPPYPGQPPMGGQPPYPGQPPMGGQPPYPGQPPMGPQTTRMARIDPGPSYAFGIIGAVVAAIGVIVGIIAFTALEWISDSDLGAKFSDLKDIVDGAADGGGSLPGDTEIYFKWLGWVLLIATFVIALLACLPSPASVVLRVIGVLAGLAGIGLTFWAVKGDNDFSDVFDHGGIGLWLALAAFLIMAVGAAFGPRRARY